MRSAGERRAAARSARRGRVRVPPRLDRDPNDWQPYALGVREYHRGQDGLLHDVGAGYHALSTARSPSLSPRSDGSSRWQTTRRSNPHRFPRIRSGRAGSSKERDERQMQRAASVLEKNLFVLDPVFADHRQGPHACRELSKKRLSRVRTGGCARWCVRGRVKETRRR